MFRLTAPLLSFILILTVCQRIMPGDDVPIENIYQQKIAFEDVQKAIPRQLPFSIDLDEVEFDWTDEERVLLSERGDNGSWIKLGWAFNRDVSEPQVVRSVGC